MTQSWIIPEMDLTRRDAHEERQHPAYAAPEKKDQFVTTRFGSLLGLFNRRVY